MIVVRSKSGPTNDCDVKIAKRNIECREKCIDKLQQSAVFLLEIFSLSSIAISLATLYNKEVKRAKNAEFFKNKKDGTK